MPYEYLVSFGGLLWFAVLGLICTLFSTILRLLLPRHRHGTVGRSLIRGFFRFYLASLRLSGIVRYQLKALDALQNTPGLILAPNHPSLIDAVLVISRLPDVTCIMKSSLYRNPMLGGARLAGYLCNDSPTGLVREASARLREGGQLLLFPEGTRTRQPGTINPLKGGSALIARHTGHPVQIIIIRTNNFCLSKHWRLWQKPDFPLVYRVELGPQITILPGEDTQAFNQRLARAYEEQQLLPQAP